MKTAVISLSGGMDSTCLLIRLLGEGYTVFGLSFDYGQRHRIELDRLQKNRNYLFEQGHALAEYRIINLKSIGRMFESSLLAESDTEVPEGHYEQTNMKATVVPNRNAIFSSIIYGWALSIAERLNQPVEVALGVHSGDHAIYPDCRPEFYEHIEQSFKMGNWNSERVNFTLPYLEADKTLILKDCLKWCDVLGLDFDTILQNTNTSYNPDSEGRASGTSGADIERIEAFININRRDPVEYVQPWDIVRNNAICVLQNK